MDEQTDILQVQGVNSRGYGTVPKLVMEDKRLTAEAKSIYAYFCSFAGAGQTAFPSHDKIISDLALGGKRYYKHFDLLKKFGYIEVKQEKGQQGQFKRNIYTLTALVPLGQNDQADDSPLGRFALTQNDLTNNNSIKNKHYSLVLSCHKYSKRRARTRERAKEDGQDGTKQDTQNKTPANILQACEAIIKANIGYDRFLHPQDKALLDEIVA